MGGSFLFIMHDQRLESAMDTVENLPDSGATEAYITDTILASLASVDANLQSLHSKFLALDADEVKLDAVRAAGALRQEGRRYSQQLATALGFLAVLSDPWTAAEPDPRQSLGDRG